MVLCLVSFQMSFEQVTLFVTAFDHAQFLSFSGLLTEVLPKKQLLLEIVAT